MLTNLFYRETDKYPVYWTILLILAPSILLNVPFCFEFDAYTFRSIYFAWLVVTSVIPTILLILFNTIIYKRFKALLTSGFFNSGANAQLQKSVFRTKITMSITCIFIVCQVLQWIWLVQLFVSFCSL